MLVDAWSFLEPECGFEWGPLTPISGEQWTRCSTPDRGEAAEDYIVDMPVPELPTLEELTLKGTGMKERLVECSGYVMALYDPTEMEKEILHSKKRIERAKVTFANIGVICQKARDLLEWIKRRESPNKNPGRGEPSQRDRILDIQRTYFTTYFPLMKEIGDAEAKEKRDEVLMKKALKY